jgi:hypothetical protein
METAMRIMAVRLGLRQILRQDSCKCIYKPVMQVKGGRLESEGKNLKQKDFFRRFSLQSSAA